jgi:hypothetical protein
VRAVSEPITPSNSSDAGGSYPEVGSYWPGREFLSSTVFESELSLTSIHSIRRNEDDLKFIVTVLFATVSVTGGREDTLGHIQYTKMRTASRNISARRFKSSVV